MSHKAKNSEFKKETTNSYLKIVSAYANYNDGQIIFGIDDNGKTVGIENTINDYMKPVPYYNLQITDENTIILNVYKNENTYYFYNGKAYKRRDSSFISVNS